MLQFSHFHANNEQLLQSSNDQSNWKKVLDAAAYIFYVTTFIKHVPVTSMSHLQSLVARETLTFEFSPKAI